MGERIDGRSDLLRVLKRDFVRVFSDDLSQLKRKLEKFREEAKEIEVPELTVFAFALMGVATSAGIVVVSTLFIYRLLFDVLDVVRVIVGGVILVGAALLSFVLFRKRAVSKERYELKPGKEAGALALALVLGIAGGFVAFMMWPDSLLGQVGIQVGVYLGVFVLVLGGGVMVYGREVSTIPEWAQPTLDGLITQLGNVEAVDPDSLFREIVSLEKVVNQTCRFPFGDARFYRRLVAVARMFHEELCENSVLDEVYRDLSKLNGEQVTYLVHVGIVQCFRAKLLEKGDGQLVSKEVVPKVGGWKYGKCTLSIWKVLFLLSAEHASELSSLLFKMEDLYGLWNRMVSEWEKEFGLLIREIVSLKESGCLSERIHAGLVPVFFTLYVAGLVNLTGDEKSGVEDVVKQVWALRSVLVPDTGDDLFPLFLRFFLRSLERESDRKLLERFIEEMFAGDDGSGLRRVVEGMVSFFVALVQVAQSSDSWKKEVDWSLVEKFTYFFAKYIDPEVFEKIHGEVKEMVAELQHR